MKNKSLMAHKLAETYEQAGEVVSDWKKRGLKVVFTNGCFDLLHIGHISTLSQAKNLGDKLVVGLNNDKSVSRLKGSTRPIKAENHRRIILASLEMVDLVVLFHEDTPLNLIKQVSPDVLVKGGDWALDQIVGSDFVLANGGEVKQIPYVDGFSTSKLAEKIQHSNDEN